MATPGVVEGTVHPTSKEALSEMDTRLTCAICLDRYTDPRSLPCSHSYCKGCIDRLPVELDNGRQVVKCLSCRKATRLSDRGAGALPVAFRINSLLDIDELLQNTSSDGDQHSGQQQKICHAHNDSLKDMYCDTCEELVCLKCVSESHSNHEYDRAEYLFTKHKKQIEACLQPMKKRIVEVEQTLARFDTREGEMREQEKAVQKEIDDTYQQFINELQESRRKLSQEAAADLQEKLQLHSVQRGNVEAVLVQLKSCCEFVEEELRSQLQYQIQAAKKQLVKRINDTHSEVKVSELQPAQEPNIVFTANKNTLSACRHIGDISSKQSFSCPGLFSVDLPSTVMYRKTETMVLTAPISLSASRLCCQLTPAQGRGAKPVVCPVTGVGEGQFSVSIRPFTAGLHHLRVLVDGVDIYGSPFPVGVAEWKMLNFATFAKDLDGPCGVAVTDDGQHVVVTELNGNCMTVFSSTGEVVRRFDGCVSGPGEFSYPWGVAVSADKHIFVANLYGKLQKFSFFSYEASTDVHGNGVAIDPSGKILTTDNEKNIQVFNDDLTPSYSFSSGYDNYDGPLVHIAVDTKGMVYVTNPHKGHILKFTAEGERLATIGSKGREPHQFAWPLGICIDSNDIMYVTDNNKNKVFMFTTEGESLGCIDDTPNPNGIAVDKIGNMYVCDTRNGQVLVSKPLQ